MDSTWKIAGEMAETSTPMIPKLGRARSLLNLRASPNCKPGMQIEICTPPDASQGGILILRSVLIVIPGRVPVA